MINSGGTAPYAPTKAVLSVIHAWRDRPVQAPITSEVMVKIGIPRSIVPRTMQTFRLLDLLDKNGHPTTAMQDLRKAGSDEYRSRLAEVIRAAYAEVFTYRDPTIDPADKIADAFRSFGPVGMRDRMVRLFLGLCVEAGIIETKPQVSSSGRPVAARTGKPTAKAPSVANQVAPIVSVPIVPIENARGATGPTGLTGLQAGADHMVVRGLLQTLPPVGTVFPDAKRREWADAVVAAFNLIYVRPSEDSEVRVTLTPSSGGGESG